MRVIYFLIVIFSLLPACLIAQDKKAFKTKFLEAEYFFYAGDFNEARFIYSELLKEDPDNANLKFLIGACYLSIAGEKSKATPYLEQAVESISPGYRDGSYKERNAPSECIFALARAYHIQNQFEKAKINYEKYRDVMRLQDPAEIDFVYKQVESCNLAEKMIKKPLPYSRTSFSSEINFNASNYNAVLSGKDTVMIFMREKPFYTAIMMTQLKNGSWRYPVVINDQLGVENHATVCSISDDGKELYISIGTDQDFDIYLSKFKKDKWSKIEKLNENVNTLYSETHASITKDGKKIYFSSDRPGGEGAMDLWVSEKGSDNDWGPAVNLGEPVNSVYSEETPFISKESNILYFSSMGHPTMGGFDVFYSSLLPSNKWSYPANIGYPVNTTDDDLFYFPLGKGQQALYSGFMDENEGKQKVFMVNLDSSFHFENIALRGTIKLEDNLQELDETFTVKIINSDTKDSVTTIIPDQKTGEYTVDLKAGNYEFSTGGKGYTEVKENIAVVEGISRNDILMKTSMTPENVSSGEFLTVKNLLFAFNDFSLNEGAKNELDKLYKVMQMHPQIYVQVAGHADSKGDAEYNIKLSAKRARAVVEYLVSKGISNERFVSLGLGEQQSIAMNQNPDGSDNPEGRRLNRYAEIKLINNSDAFIKIEPIEVPQHLRPKTDFFYSVLLTQTADSTYFPKDIKGAKITLTETDHGRLFFTEEFRDRQKSVEMLNFAIDNGFPDAMIFNQWERENLVLFLSDRSEESQSPYTIQIMALKKPVDLKDLSSLGEISQFTCSDGYFRYTRGFYLTHAEALKDLQKINGKFPDAFIIPLYRYSKNEAKSDDRTTSQAYYTIQFSATTKALDRNKYKNLENVQTIYGNDGYYRYTLGIYKSRHEAEIELNRIKSLGYGDAFLKKLEKSN
jgi:outer membrane protein OmpA-like peptidoglycan-associated protein